MTSEDRQYDWWRDPERLAALTDDSRRENIARYATGTAGHSKCVVTRGSGGRGLQCAERREFLRSGPYRWHLDKAQKAAIAETFANMKRAQCRLKLSVMEADASLRQMCTRAHLVTASRWRFPQAKAAMFSVSRRSVQSARESGPASKRAKCSV